MKLLSKLTTRIQRAVLVAVLAGTALVPFASTSQVNAYGAYLASGYTVINGPVPTSSNNRSGVTIKPLTVTAPQDSYNIQWINGSSTSNVVNELSLLITPTEIIGFCDVTGKVGNFVTGDYGTPASGVVLTTGSTTCGFSYPYALTTGHTYRIDADFGMTGEIGVYLKDDSAVEVMLTSFKYSGTQITTPAPTQTYAYVERSSCEAITATETEIVALVDDVAGVSFLFKDTGTCSGFNASTYDTTSKVVTAKYVAGSTSGITVKHSATFGVNGAGTNNFGFTTSLATAKSSGSSVITYFKDGLGPTSSADQKIYLVATSDGKDGFTDKDQFPVAIGNFDFSSTNKDFKDVKLGSSRTKYAAFAHSLNTLTKDGSFTLMVPFKDGDKYVGVCTGAASLDAVSGKCNGIYYLKEGQTKTSKETKSIPVNRSVNATTTTVNGVKFWVVDGLTGSGAFSANIASDPETGISVSATSTPIAVGVMVMALGAAVFARRSLSKK